MHTYRTLSRLEPGAVVAARSLLTVAGVPVSLPDPDRLTHLQFRRFAGCPICNLHLRSFAKGVAQLDAAGIRIIAFFHSSAESMRPYHADLPFPVVPDLERRWYERFGVERSAL